MYYELILQIFSLVIVLVGAVCTASLSLYLELCLKKGMIFGFWLPWLAETYVKSHLKEFNNWRGVPAALGFTEESERELFFEFTMENFFLFKPLGACLYCVLPYLSVVSFLFWHYVFEVSWVWLIPFILLSFIIVRSIKILEEKE